MKATTVQIRRLVCLADLNLTEPKSVRVETILLSGNKKDSFQISNFITKVKRMDFEGNNVEGVDHL